MKNIFRVTQEFKGKYLKEQNVRCRHLRQEMRIFLYTFTILYYVGFSFIAQV